MSVATQGSTFSSLNSLKEAEKRKSGGGGSDAAIKEEDESSVGSFDGDESFTDLSTSSSDDSYVSISSASQASEDKKKSKHHLDYFFRKFIPYITFELTCSGIRTSFKKFWHNFSVRVWNFYADALYIPSYRYEWGKYSKWNYRTATKVTLKEEQIKALDVHARRRKILRHMRRYGGPGIIHNSSECDVVTFNVSGCRYQTQVRTLNQFPETLLGDEMRRIRFFNPTTGEFFLDRHRSTFEAVLHYYQSGGVLVRPSNIPFKIFENEIRFYELGDQLYKNYLEDEGVLKDEDPELPKGIYQRKIWLLMEFPESSKQARIVSLISIFVIIFSIVIFCLETLPAFTSDNIIGFSVGDPFFVCETTCVGWFCLEIIIRFLSSPSKVQFIGNLLNIIDIVSVIPYFLQFIALQSSSSPEQTASARKRSPAATLAVFRVIRLVRVFRIFKLSRHSKGLQILGKTLRASLRELGLLIFFLIIGIILFSSAMYFAEFNEESKRFKSIPEAFWWGVITMTTIGYGDLVPTGTMGKIIGGLCAIGGVLTIALPVPVIVANFNYFYNRESESFTRQEVGKNRHITDCPFRPTCGRPETHFYGHTEIKRKDKNKKESGDASSLIGTGGYKAARRSEKRNDKGTYGASRSAGEKTPNRNLIINLRKKAKTGRSQTSSVGGSSKV